VVIPSEGGKARKFSFPTGRRQAGSYKWLPDSSGLGMVLRDNEQRLYLARLELDTGEWKTSPISAEGLSIYVNSIEWSGDGKSFFIIKKEDDGSDESELNITRVDLETGQEHCLFRLPKMVNLLSLKASRDYKRLATGIGGKIVLVDTETGHAERLEYDRGKGIRFPSWSPDGKHLVVIGASNEESRNFEIFIISLPDGQLKSLNISRYLPRRLGFFPMCQPDWSPDGRKIVFNTQLFTGEFNLIQNLLPKK
jgi:Tol biopolymer transport system component